MADFKQVLLLLLVAVAGTGIFGAQLRDEHALRTLSGETTCSAPLPAAGSSTGYGCFDLTTLTQLAVTSSLHKMGAPNQWITDLINPVVSAVSTSASEKFDILNAGYCLGTFSGADASSGPCSELPLSTAHDWSVFSATIPASIVGPVICPSAEGLADIEMCVAFTSCGSANEPSIAVKVNKAFVSCMLGNDAIDVATAGLNNILVAGARAGLKTISSGLSSTGIFTKEVEIWDGSAVRSIAAQGNYFDSIAVSIPTGQLGIPPAYFALSGQFSRLVSIWGDGSTVVSQLNSAQDMQSTLSALVSQFSALGSVSIDLGLKIGSLTKGALPDVSVTLAEASIYMTTGDTLAGGFYIFATAADPVAAVAGSLIQIIVDNFGGILDQLFGSGVAQQILNNAKPDGSSNTVVAFTVTVDLAGFYVKLPVAGALGGVMDADCQVKFSNGAFSCKFDYTEPKWINAASQTAGWVMTKATSLFDDTGDIIGAISNNVASTLEKGVYWTLQGMQTTAQEITNGVVDMGEAVEEWAKTKGTSLCGTTTVTSAADCGTKAVVSAALCGTSTVTSAADCGTKVVTSAALCGTKVVTSAAECGTSTVTSAALCGTTWGTSAATCGTSTVTNAAICGTSTVNCGWKTITGGICGFKKNGLPKSCKKEKKCNQANSCSQANSCNIPNSCSQPNSCSVAQQCSVAQTCSISNTCNVAQTCAVPNECSTQDFVPPTIKSATPVLVDGTGNDASSSSASTTMMCFRILLALSFHLFLPPL